MYQREPLSLFSLSIQTSQAHAVWETALAWLNLVVQVAIACGVIGTLIWSVKAHSLQSDKDAKRHADEMRDRRRERLIAAYGEWAAGLRHYVAGMQRNSPSGFEHAQNAAARARAALATIMCNEDAATARHIEQETDAILSYDYTLSKEGGRDLHRAVTTLFNDRLASLALK